MLAGGVQNAANSPGKDKENGKAAESSPPPKSLAQSSVN
jgi:hypothetical protein